LRNRGSCGYRCDLIVVRGRLARHSILLRVLLLTTEVMRNLELLAYLGAVADLPAFLGDIGVTAA
jgi:hypothetical protein